MSMQPHTFDPIPDETLRVARAAFPKGNLWMTLRDTLGAIYQDDLFEGLFPRRGQPAQSPWRLALVTLLQFAEGLSDRQAAEAVRRRIDWKYLLALPLDDAGFDSSVLCEFRARLVAGAQETLLFETLLTHLKDKQFLKARGRQRTDSTHVLAAVRPLSRLTCVGETLRRALQALEVLDPAWFQAWVPADFLTRYDRRFEDYRLPSERQARHDLGETIGRDGWFVLETVLAPTAPAYLRQVPAVQVLRRVWIQQFVREETRLRWRTAEELPPGALLISTPYDVDARYSQKRETQWTGYKVQGTETCEGDTPPLITSVQTTAATTSDQDLIEPVHQDLQGQDLLPGQHIVDAGSMSADQIVSSRKDYGVDLLGPVAEDPSWQARTKGAFDLSHFQIDWSAQTVTCPQGQSSLVWLPGQDQGGHEVIYVRFASKVCRRCPVREQCTTPGVHPRKLCLRTQESYEALEAARQRQKTGEYRRAYATRAGIEGTLSQGVRVCDWRQCRYIGLTKTRLQHLLAAAAMNLLRVGAWLLERPRAQTRQTRLARLATQTSRSACAA